MTGIIQSKIEELHRRLNENIEEIGITEIKIDENEIIKYCELIKENNLIFKDDKVAINAGFEGKIIHPSYITSLTNPIVQQIIIKGGPELYSSLIKAYIHVGSEVEYKKPMVMNKKYKIKTELSESVEKTGKKGSFCSNSFTFSVMDENNDVYAIENHISFYKL